MEEKFLTLNNLSYFKTKQDAFNDSKFATKTELAAAKTELEEAIAEVAGGEVGSVIEYKGVKDTVAELPQEGNEVGDSYYVTEDNSMHVWNGTSWDSVGEIVVPSIDWADITGKPESFTPAEHTHVVDDIEDLDLSKYVNYTFDTEHVIQIPMDMGTVGMTLKPGVYLMVEGAELPEELQAWKTSVGFEGAISGYLYVFEYMNGEYPDHLLMYQVDMRSADGAQHVGSTWVFEGATKKWAQPKAVIDSISGLQDALDAKAGKDVATTDADGLMSSEDKTKLDGLAGVEAIDNTEIDALFE